MTGDIGVVAESNNELHEAMDCYLAIDLQAGRDLANAFEISNALQNMSNVFQQFGDFQSALECLTVDTPFTTTPH